jgi:hypothetical protein
LRGVFLYGPQCHQECTIMAKVAAKKSAAHGALVATLQARFDANMARHNGLKWGDVESRLGAAQLRVLQQMEDTGGEPDVIGRDAKTGELLFVDCAPESPAGRRSLCYDGVARLARKEARPKSSAVEMAAAIGIDLLDEAGYRALQEFGAFDTKTSSWILTPARIRKLDGALFCDFRYGQVFTYHNGAQSYYAARGFRGLLKV